MSDYETDILEWSERQAALLRRRAGGELINDAELDWPLSRDMPHWQFEVRRFRIDAADRFAPSMRQRIDLAKLYHQALRIMPETIDDQLPLPVPQTCPMTLDELLSEKA